MSDVLSQIIGSDYLQGMDVVQGTTDPVWKTVIRYVRRQNQGGHSTCIRVRLRGCTALRPYIGDGQLKERGVRGRTLAFRQGCMRREDTPKQSVSWILRSGQLNGF